MAREFKAEGFKLDVDDAVLDAVAAEALRRETGARGLASTLTRNLEDVAFDQFGSEVGATVRVRMIAGTLDVAIDDE
jgi:ATP-dependent protease Clp ATPase subunit